MYNENKSELLFALSYKAGQKYKNLFVHKWSHKNK